MGIRSNKNTKDRLRGYTEPIFSLVQPTRQRVQDPLRFRTAHLTKPCYVDLTRFETGKTEAIGGGKIRWLGAYTGRPELILELAPAIRDRLVPLASKSVTHFIAALTTWWRIFDEIERHLSGSLKIVSVTQLTDLHRQFAMDREVSRDNFGDFLSLANVTRKAMGHRALYWMLPPAKDPKRYLAPQESFLVARRELRRNWFNVLDRWDLTQSLLHDSLDGCLPAAYTPQRKLLLRNYQHFKQVVTATGRARPDAEALYCEMSSGQFSAEGYSVREMLSGFYPNGNDIRTAFHLCLATTGWNPAVLLSLDVSQTFIEVHPMDANRYLLRGSKARAGGTEQVSEGLSKSHGSAGVILQTLIERTEPLREQLRNELEACKMRRTSVDGQDSEQKAVTLDRRIARLEHAIRSPWLYFTTSTPGEVISALTDTTYSSSSNASKGSFMDVLVEKINLNLPEDRRISPMKSGDFRDAYAYDSYHASGGSILSVMRALGHKHVQSTATYLQNTLIVGEHLKLFSTFSNSLWSELKLTGRVDPTVIAKWSRDGEVTDNQRERLGAYRKFFITRVGVGCKDPHHPPAHIDPNFVGDGVAVCCIQRCTLCIEHAIITPESMHGLCKRLAELRHIQSGMGLRAFSLESRFPEEIKNTEIALLAFDEVKVDEMVAHWESLFRSGAHRVPEFDGTGRGVNL